MPRSLSIYLLEDIWALSSFRLLQIKLLLIFVNKKTNKQKICKFSYISLELVANKQLLHIILFKLPLKLEITLFNMTVFNIVGEGK